MTRADSGADSVTEKRKDNNTEAARRAFTIKTILIMNIDLQLQLKSIYQRRIVYCRYLYRRTLGMVKIIGNLMKFFGKHYKEKNYNKKRLGENNKIINVKGKKYKILARNKETNLRENIFTINRDNMDDWNDL